MLEEGFHSHADTSNGVRRVPEADIAGILSTCRRVPRHDEKVELNADVEDDNHMPSFELRLRKISLSAAPANDVDSHGHGQVEGSRWEHSEVIH